MKTFILLAALVASAAAASVPQTQQEQELPENLGPLPSDVIVPDENDDFAKERSCPPGYLCCPGGWWPNRNGQYNACCKNWAYHRSTKTCCDGWVWPKYNPYYRQNKDRCCGYNPYVSSRQYCCPNANVKPIFSNLPNRC